MPNRVSPNHVSVATLIHDCVREKTTKNTSAGELRVENNRQYPRRQADALILMAEAYLEDTKVASHTDDRYQVVVHVDSEVLSQRVFEKPSGEPDCYIEKQKADSKKPVR